MENEMFCFQCEQTAWCNSCSEKVGICGKSAEVANLQDQLTGALIGPACTTDGDTHPTPQTWKLMVEGQLATVTNVNFHEGIVQDLIWKISEEKAALLPECTACTSPCGRTTDYSLSLLWNADPDIRLACGKYRFHDLDAESMTFRCPWYFPGISRKLCVFCCPFYTWASDPSLSEEGRTQAVRPLTF